MRVLLDENLDHALRKPFGQHDVITVTYRGWAGLKNGELLQAAEADGFDGFLTGDQTLSYEQNLSRRRLAIVALSRHSVTDHPREPIEDNRRHRRRRARFLSHRRVRDVQPEEAARTFIGKFIERRRAGFVLRLRLPG